MLKETAASSTALPANINVVLNGTEELKQRLPR
jgi:hypothetical protein